MKNILTLYKILTKNAEMRLPKKGSKGTMYLALGIIALSCIMIPCCLIIGFITYIMTLALELSNAPTGGLLAEIHIMSAMSMIFGVLVIFNIMFFSSDREHLVPLPFKSYEIMAGKFLYSYLAESVMEFMILISMFVGFFIAKPNGIISILSAIIGIVLIPLLPLCYCVIISLIIFGLIKNIHRTKIINHLSTIIMLIFIGLFLLSFKDMGGITVDNYLATLGDNSNLFSRILNKIFFTVPFLLKAIESNSIINLLFYLLTNAAMILVMLVLGNYLYQPCLYAVGAMGDSKKKNANKAAMANVKSPFWSYISKEYKVLIRTKAYNNNCFFINLLWPFGAGLLFYLGRNKEGIQKIIESYRQGLDNAHVIICICIVLLSFIATAMNSIASTSFTREGAHLSLVKYIPIPYKTQMYAKEFVSISITYPPLLLTLAILAYVFNFSIINFIFYSVVILLCVVITTVMGLYLDSAAPHSTWDDEYSALRGNMNTFFDMAIIMVLSLIICGVCFVIYNFTSIGIVGFQILILLIPLIIAILCTIVGHNKIVANMEEM